MFNRKIFLYLSFFFLLNLLYFTSKGQNNTTVINKLSEGLGNLTSLNAARFIMFSSVLNNDNLLQGEHTFLYDRETMEGRFEGLTKEGKSLTVLFNSKKDTGKVFIDRKETNAPEIVKTIAELFIEDSYYLFTPMLVAANRIKSTVQDSEIIDSKRY